MTGVIVWIDEVMDNMGIIATFQTELTTFILNLTKCSKKECEDLETCINYILCGRKSQKRQIIIVP